MKTDSIVGHLDFGTVGLPEAPIGPDAGALGADTLAALDGLSLAFIGRPGAFQTSWAGGWAAGAQAQKQRPGLALIP
jgi:hypothetical protein